MTSSLSKHYSHTGMPEEMRETLLTHTDTNYTTEHGINQSNSYTNPSLLEAKLNGANNQHRSL